MLRALLFAADAPAQVSTYEWIVQSEGWFFWPQTIFAILMLTIVLSAFEMTRRGLIAPRKWERQLTQTANASGRPLARWEQVTSASACPLVRAVRAGWLACRHGNSLAEAEEAATSVYESVSLTMERRLSWINALAHVSMSTGLLGTVWGLVNSFTVIAQGGDAPPPSELAGGVSMALVTTIFGLLTAIPGLFAQGLLRPLSNRLLYDLESAALTLVRQIFHESRGTPPSPPTRAS